jgi:hypothetical protein
VFWFWKIDTKKGGNVRPMEMLLGKQNSKNLEYEIYEKSILILKIREIIHIISILTDK